MGREQEWGHPRATPGFGVFWFIPPLQSKPIFGQPPLKRGFSLVCTQGRRDLSSSGVYMTKSWLLEGVRIWKLSRTYPGEKPPSLSVLTHGCSLVARKPTRHLLVIFNILVRVGTPYEGGWSIQFHLPRNMAPSLNPRFLKLFLNFSNMSILFQREWHFCHIIHNIVCKKLNTMFKFVCIEL